MDLLRLPWNGGNQRRRQFPIDQLFRQNDRAAPPQAQNDRGDRGDRGGGGFLHPMERDDSFFQMPSKESKVTSPLQKVLDGTYSLCMTYGSLNQII